MARPGFALSRFDAASATADDVTGAHAVDAAIAEEVTPGEPAVPLEEAAVAIRHPDPSEHYVHWLARDRDGRPLAHASVVVDLVDNPRLAWCDVMVVPAARRRGIGTALLHRAAREAAALDRATLGVDTHERAPGPEVVAPLGFTPRQVGHRNRLLVADVDRALLDRWARQTPGRAEGYRLHFWEGPVPPEILGEMAGLLEVMNTAPTGGLDIDDGMYSPAFVRAREAARAARGLTTWTLVASAPGGHLAGYTEVLLPAGRPAVALQNDTGVDPGHRHKGLGRWLKAEMLARLLDGRPQVDRVETWNAADNAPILSINTALGFRPIDVETSWQAETSEVVAALEPRVRRAGAATRRQPRLRPRLGLRP